MAVQRQRTSAAASASPGLTPIEPLPCERMHDVCCVSDEHSSIVDIQLGMPEAYREGSHRDGPWLDARNQRGECIGAMVQYVVAVASVDVRVCERRMGRDRVRVLVKCDFYTEVVRREQGDLEQAHIVGSRRTGEWNAALIHLVYKKNLS